MINKMFIRVLSTLALLFLLGAPWAEAAGPYMRGPMIGHVSPTTAVIWAYTKNRPGVRVYYRPTAAPASQAKYVEMDASATGSRRARVLLTGLTPATEYVYRVFFRRQTEPTWRGDFRTPPPQGTPLRFKMAVSSCMKPDAPSHHSFTLLQNEDPDFHLLLGDNHYEDDPHMGRLWGAYLAMRKIPAFGALLREVPTYAMWDDHDFAGDNRGGEVKNKAESLEAFKEVWANPSAGLPDLPGAFFQLSWGNVDFFVLDGRYYRSRLEAPNNDRKRMIGDAQYRWFARALKASTAPFKIIASGSTIEIEGEDTWVNYRFELQRIWNLIKDERIPGVLWMSGDLHRSLIDTHPKAETGFYDLHEIISSGIANSDDESFATLTFDTTIADPSVHVKIHHKDGSITQEKTIRSSELVLQP
jgi:alkaline phosphatase D